MNWASLTEMGVNVMPKALLSAFTTLQLGGPCKYLVSCSVPEHLTAVVAALANAEQDFILIGGGSNLLVSDAGLDAVVVKYGASRPLIWREGNNLEVTGATLLDDLVQYTVEQGLDGLVHCSGIPGTVGGAVAGNAGAFGKQIGDRVESALIMDHRGVVRLEGKEFLGFGYRRSKLQEQNDIVLTCWLRMDTGGRDTLWRQRQEILEMRRQKHPDWHTTRTAGSFFKNVEPSSAAERRQAAGWFLEQAGAKELRVGGARLFDKHANIIVAEERCTAQDVLDLSRKMAEAVKQKFGIELIPEVRVLGRFA